MQGEMNHGCDDYGGDPYREDKTCLEDGSVGKINQQALGEIIWQMF